MKQLIAIGLLLLAGTAMAQVTPVAPPGTIVGVPVGGGTVAPTAQSSPSVSGTFSANGFALSASTLSLTGGRTLATSLYYSASTGLTGAPSTPGNAIIGPAGINYGTDAVDTTTNGNGSLAGWYVNLAPSAGFTGGRETMLAELNITGTPTLVNAAGLLSFQALTRTSANLTGTSGAYTNYKGAVFGGGCNNYTTSGATYLSLVNCMEFDTNIGTGSNTADLFGISIVSTTGHALRGDYDDAAVSIQNQDGVLVTRHFGVEYGGYAHAWAFGGDSSLATVQLRQSGSQGLVDYLQNGYDIRNATITQAATLTFTSAPTAGATSATLNANWGAGTTTYEVHFSDGEVRSTALTNAAATATWVLPLTGNPTVTATIPSGYAFASPGFSVDPVGDLTVGPLSKMGTSLYPIFQNQTSDVISATSGNASFTCTTCANWYVGAVVYQATAFPSNAIVTSVASSPTINVNTNASATVTNGTASVGYNRFDTNSTVLANTVAAKSLFTGLASQNNSSWTDAYLPTDCAHSVVCALGYTTSASLFGLRTSDNAAISAVGSLNLTGLAVNDNTTTSHTLWNVYLQGEALSGSAASNETFDIENDIGNQNTAVNVTPYGVNVFTGTYNDRLGCGNGISAETSCTVAMDIVNNGAAFRTGINIGSTALDSSVLTHPSAISMPAGTNGASLSWYRVNTYSTPAWQVYSTNATTNGNYLALNDASLGTNVEISSTLAPASNTVATGALLTDVTPATSANQQYSPSLQFTGYGWGTTTPSSEEVDWRIYNVPVQGTTTPNTNLVFDRQLNVAGWVNDLTLSSTAFTFGNTTDNPTYTFQGTGAISFNGGGLMTVQALNASYVNVSSTTAPTTGIYRPTTSTLGFSAGGGAVGVVDSQQHWRLGNSTNPTIASGACGTGTNGSIASNSNDQAGEISIGALATTTCTITFSATFATIPRAVHLQAANATAAASASYISSLAAGSFVITGTALAATNWYYWVQ